jgi:hypothetical protein
VRIGVVTDDLRAVDRHASHMAKSYAVTWREETLPTYTGKLELGPSGLRFEGGSTRGRSSVQAVPYSDIVSVWIGRGREQRVQGRPVLLLERRSGGLIRIASLNGLGTIREIADRLEAFASGARSA